MTGDTLQDLVEKGGPARRSATPWPRSSTWSRGCREAHRLGLIHRDVKPSNCFLDGEGRVKVGDFGLSKSQVGSAHLTRTGSFLGTPLYASPEQIKVEPLDGRTDVYSTAATLFFLLTGRAPFDRGDASATMARIVTDPAPSAREKRPEVPVGLDRAIRKGLERDRDRRYRDLDEFRRRAPAVRPRARPGGAGRPAGRGIPGRILLPVIAAIILRDGLLGSAPWPLVLDDAPLSLGTRFSIGFLVALAYFAVGDGVFGGTPGKRLLRMRVADAGGRNGRRGPEGGLAGPGVPDPDDSPGLILGPFRDGSSIDLFLGGLVAWVLGFAVLVATMRASRERRGLHDWLSGTRVVAPPEVERRRYEAFRLFAPGLVPAARVSLRIWAYLGDYSALAATIYLIFAAPLGWPFWLNAVVSHSVIMAYWTVGDGIFGASPGKRLLRMRVADAGGREAAGAARAALWALVFPPPGRAADHRLQPRSCRA